MEIEILTPLNMSRLSPVGLIFAAVALAWVPTPVQAHPHVWIEARATLRFEGGRPVSVLNAWTFDPAYSAFLTMGAPRGADGTADPKTLDASAAKAVASVAESGYFTDVRAGGLRMANGEPRGATMRVEGGRATLSFELPLAERYPGTAAAGGAKVEIMDPGYFVSFTFAEGDPVTLEGAPPGCAVSVHRPRGFTADDARTLAAGVLTALTGADASDRIGNSATVTCPAP